MRGMDAAGLITPEVEAALSTESPAFDTHEQQAPALQQAVREAALQVFGEDPISLSVGVASAPGSHIDAARDLIRAKRHGCAAPK